MYKYNCFGVQTLIKNTLFLKFLDERSMAVRFSKFILQINLNDKNHIQFFIKIFSSISAINVEMFDNPSQKLFILDIQIFYFLNLVYLFFAQFKLYLIDLVFFYKTKLKCKIIKIHQLILLSSAKWLFIAMW